MKIIQRKVKAYTHKEGKLQKVVPKNPNCSKYNNGRFGGRKSVEVQVKRQIKEHWHKIIASWLISISILIKNTKSHKTTLYSKHLYIQYIHMCAIEKVQELQW